jgi:CRISPR-associated protein Cas1
MSAAYIIEQGAFLTKEGDVLLIKKGKEVIRSIHAHHLTQLVISGNVTLTTQTIAFLLEKGIDTVFLSIYGKYRGRLSSKFSKNIEIRKIQFERFADENFKLELAKKFVYGKLYNCLKVLRRRLVERKMKSLREPILGIRNILNKVDTASTLDVLRGYEGAAARGYFNGFGKMLMQEDFVFEKRSRRPPLDMPNSLLSLGYTLLNNTVQSLVESSGMDPYLGVFHQPEYGRPSLGLDLMEEFRPVIVDILVLNLINKKMITKEDFNHQPGGELPYRLTQLGMKKFILNYEKRLQLKVQIPEIGKTFSYFQVIQDQLFKLQRHLTDNEEYTPFIMSR